MINRNEPFPYKLYVKELETELAVAENTIHKAEESFQTHRNNYHDLQDYVSILQDILLKNGISFQNFTVNWGSCSNKLPMS